MEAGESEIFSAIENTELIDFSRRSKTQKRQNCPQLERIWNREIFSFAGELHITYVATRAEDLLKHR